MCSRCASAAPIFGIDSQGRVNEWNNKAADITGFSREEVMGQDLVQVRRRLAAGVGGAVGSALTAATRRPPTGGL